MTGRWIERHIADSVTCELAMMAGANSNASVWAIVVEGYRADLDSVAAVLSATEVDLSYSDGR